MTRIDRLLDIMAGLRNPDGGCPWDLEQDFASIAPYTLEEAYEVDDAIRREDWEGLRDELGDLLLQVVFHAQMAHEAELFDFAGVVEAICDKLVRRHPHVFGDAEIADADAQTRSWEKIKEAERARRAAETGEGGGPLDGVPLGLPALSRAAALLRRAARAGIDVRDEPLELCSVSTGEALGKHLFACVALAGRLGIDPETALREANATFEKLARAVEQP